LILAGSRRVVISDSDPGKFESRLLEEAEVSREVGIPSCLFAVLTRAYRLEENVFF